MSANAIITGSAAPGPAATGYSPQNHLIYAVNRGVWVCFYLTSTAGMAMKYSADGASWTSPTNSPLTMGDDHASEARNYAFGYGSIGGYDVFHLGITAQSAGQGRWERSTLDAGGPPLVWTKGTNITTLGTIQGCAGIGPNGIAIVIGSDDKPDMVRNYTGDMWAYDGSNADAGSAWTSGWAAAVKIYNGETYAATSFAIASLGSGNLLAIADNAQTNNGTDFTVLNWQVRTSGTWTNTNANTCFAAPVTKTSNKNWTIAPVATNDIHLISLSNNSNAYVHRRFNGTAWGAGDAIPTLTLDAGSGLAAVTDGTYVWLFATIGKVIKYIKWTSGAGTPWGGGAGWVTLEDRSANNQPTYLTAAIKADGSSIELAWTEVNGSNNEIWSSNLNLSPPSGNRIRAVICTTGD